MFKHGGSLCEVVLLVVIERCMIEMDGEKGRREEKAKRREL